MYVDQILKLETKIGGFIVTRKWCHREVGRDTDKAHHHSDLVLKRLHQQLGELEEHLSYSHGKFALPYVTMETVRRHLEELVDAAASTADVGIAECLVELGSKSIHRFWHALNQAGFSLTTEFVAYLLKNPSLPYGASNTLQRLFLSIDSDIPLSLESQTLFVEQLDDTLEPHLQPTGSRLPESITNILQGIVPAITDASCKLKAMRTLHLYRKRFPSNDAAFKALALLQEDLPHPAYSSSPPLDLFDSHVYANTKLDKTVARTRSSGELRDTADFDTVFRGPSITRLPLLKIKAMTRAMNILVLIHFSALLH